ncbi:interferon-induced very large GTPase 1-like isoform X1 [Clarias gariepinus]|uniref:interferon-induced very large GTPase 1-like isoform X1 n=2 Tax=Clarias gariepinus TaxID=13013 RepID=UPI00234DAF76|nr:interferon-induced very large GTPase 1-like isoform X1 [Clarias gariepinus]
MDMSKTKEVFKRLNLTENHKLKTSDVLQITPRSFHWQEPQTDKELAETFLQRLVMMDYNARYLTTKEEGPASFLTEPAKEQTDIIDVLCSPSLNNESHKDPVHPMDVQMAVFHRSDHFLKQLIVTKLSQCQYALPLLVPNPFSKEIEFPLWTFQQIKKSWKAADFSGKVQKAMPISQAQTAMVAFFRFGSVACSKSQLMNNLLNEKHHTFFHRHCPGSSKNRVLMDGVVEIAWYCPSGEETDHFTDCVAFCNLHGDAKSNKLQLDSLIKMSSVNVLLLSDPKNETYTEMIQEVCRDNKPVIFLLSEDNSGITMIRPGKYKIGLKERNQSDVNQNLRTTIKECLSKSTSHFKLENMSSNNWIKDENNAECQQGKKAATQIISLLEGKLPLSKLKDKHLPCQGKLWHDWCKENKDLHRHPENNTEAHKSEKQRKIRHIRQQQHKCGPSDLMKQFISSLNYLAGNEHLYFLKWLGILLDKCTLSGLSSLYYKYDEKWNRVLELKKKHDTSCRMKDEQTELEEISRQLTAAFGLEHILREMGQIYESFISVQTHSKTGENMIALPRLAAQLIISGHPMELMDGDAAYVPLIWVSAVLDELVKILGDQRVFVLSVLGIQSSGKSTMLNVMFGLQFAVSAGRCTRGAFMQLVRVSEEMKHKLKFDYILVVDTEGLRALELAGTSTRNHDNELATFVVGLGNLTLINIFGENPAELQDILQIVVQAFLRMKKVRLNPSCVFVHQNVGDITAGEKNMEGRRRLQEELDEMTRLAAKEEDSFVESFSDVIEFDVQDDVHYFPHLWEGSPPMAPPNPSYSRNVKNLKEQIFQKNATSHALSLSQFKLRISDLWNALLNENFVFSFKNTLEIAVYRKLETKFGKWSWSLRSEMLAIEERLYNRIENENLEKIEEKELFKEMKKTKEEVDKSVKDYFENDRDKDILIQWRVRYKQKITQLLQDLVNNARRSLNNVIQLQNTREIFEHKRTQNEYDGKLFNLSKELAQKHKGKATEEQFLQHEFDKVWDSWVTDLTQGAPRQTPFNFWEDVLTILVEENNQASVYERKNHEEYKHIDTLGDYSHYIHLLKGNVTHKEQTHKLTDKIKSTVTFKESKDGKPQLSCEGNKLLGDLTRNIIHKSEEQFQTVCIKIQKLGYKDSYIQLITDHVKERVRHHNKDQQIKLKNEFTLDLCLHVCELASQRFTEHHERFKESNDPRVYLSKLKPQFYSVFKNYCKGATTATIFGELFCSNLKESILQAAYNKTAFDLAAQIRSDMSEFNGNRSNLEKHILKCLAQEENFEKYMDYVCHPYKHFRHFISEKVHKYITENDSKVLHLFKEDLKYKEQRVSNALTLAAEEVQNSRGDADMWLRSFFSSVKDEISFKQITFTDHIEMTEFSFLQEVVNTCLTETMSEMHTSFNSSKDIKMENFRKKPDEILIEHLCQCCWVQCPFCYAICTNTIEGHDGDHSVPFHRANGITGTHYRHTTNLTCGICTTNVQSDRLFVPNYDKEDSCPYKSYRSAGGVYASWSITPDNSELIYWKWFMCRFQKDLEKHYNKTFKPDEIPSNWKQYTKPEAIASLDNYI